MIDGWGFLEVLVAGLAAFRLWVLLSSDTILSPVRDRLPLRFVEFLTCPWCAGFWSAVVVFVTVEVWGDGAWVGTGLLILALSGLVGLFGVWSSDKGDG